MNARSPATLVADTGRGNEAAILNAALDAFGTAGFHGASMRDVAKRAGTSLSNLYNYVPSKSRLLAEVLRRANDELAARLRAAVDDAGDDAVSRLREAVRAYIRFIVEHQVAMVVSTNEVRYLTGADRASLVAERDATQAVFEGIVAQGVAEGAFRTPYPDDAARTVLTALGAVAGWYRPDGRLSRGQLAEQQARYALALLEAPLPH
ncbi:TetR family transcriptional regulator [Actinomycetospora termitidis]|uniref:TetR family transcriptional regulator n=1 Tax=Actinomycetospora termitidis TaxID=3053470 RepID=A0ABT7MGU6_9PSEU|nr:TetR family transcriptional regulator [Actinomycetospora sp. Odt1-22]MDL5159907.1 TetR family transcriptional regulator [Actinomycetospora sp. Odt1-22]